MKKTVTTVERFRYALVELEHALRLAEHVTRASSELPHGDADAWLVLARLQVSEPAPAPSRGRGERVAVEVTTAWNDAPFGSDAAPLAALRQHVATLAGVEEVGEVTADTQIRAIWGFRVVLRLTQ